MWRMVLLEDGSAEGSVDGVKLRFDIYRKGTPTRIVRQRYYAHEDAAEHGLTALAEVVSGASVDFLVELLDRMRFATQFGVVQKPKTRRDRGRSV